MVKDGQGWSGDGPGLSRMVKDEHGWLMIVKDDLGFSRIFKDGQQCSEILKDREVWSRMVIDYQGGSRKVKNMSVPGPRNPRPQKLGQFLGQKTDIMCKQTNSNINTRLIFFLSSCINDCNESIIYCLNQLSN